MWRILIGIAINKSLHLCRTPEIEVLGRHTLGEATAWRATSVIWYNFICRYFLFIFKVFIYIVNCNYNHKIKLQDISRGEYRTNIVPSPEVLKATKTKGCKKYIKGLVEKFERRNSQEEAEEVDGDEEIPDVEYEWDNPEWVEHFVSFSIK